MKINKLYKNILSFILIFTILLSNLSLSYSISKDTININSLEDLVEFSKNATLDTYYDNKTVILNSDIDLSALNSFSIPTFNGIFDGQGHTISGFSISKSGSVQGLFRYLQEDGLIKNLNVSGDISPSGSQNIIGGIIGNNKGKIEHCNFIGNVQGKNNIGGIVGINEATGTISNCESEGIVIGEHFVGGISGQNLGTILKSTNSSEVNTSLEDTSISLDDIDWTKINSVENVSAQTDIGGITGLSTGYIQDSTNRGPVGYKHMGYNVGGIVGRQSGYLSNCENYNTVLGRKDVGGIVGQIEPHLMLLFSEDTLQKLDKELKTLEDVLSSSFDNFKSYSVSDEIDSIINSVDLTKESMRVLSRETGDHIDNITDTVNITNERIRYTLDEISPILEETEDFSDIVNIGLDHMEVGFDNLKLTSDDISDAFDEGDYAISDLREAIRSSEDAISNLRKAMENLADNIEDGNITDDVFIDIESSLGDLEDKFKDLSDIDASGKLRKILEETLFGDNLSEKLIKALESLSDSELDKLEIKLKKILEEALDKLEGDFSVKEVVDNLFKDIETIFKTIENLDDDTFANFIKLLNNLSEELEKLNKEKLEEVLKDELDKLNKEGEYKDYTILETVKRAQNYTNKLISSTLNLIVELNNLNKNEDLSELIKALEDLYKNNDIPMIKKIIKSLSKETEFDKIIKELIEKSNDPNYQFSEDELISNLVKALENLNQEALEKLKNAIDSIDKDAFLDELFKNDIFKYLKDLSNPFDSMADSVSSLKNIFGKFDKAGDNIISISDELSKDLDYVFDDFEDSSKKLDDATKGISDTFSKLSSAFDESSNAFDAFGDGFDEFSNASSTMTDVVGSIKDLVDSLVDKPNIELPNISSEYRQSGEDLFDNMGDITSNFSALNDKVRNTKDSIVDDIETINDQIFNIFDILREAKDDVGSSDYIEDISDENIDENSLGTVYKNRNYGSIDADINVGGIVGAMAIEYDIDPEDDIFKKGDRSLNFKYLTTSILKNSINHGKVESKKDYVGGIVGRMDLGIISDSENYGEVESREGSYVGGIAGGSYTKIYNSYSLSSISGEDYVGGIAGYGKDILDSYALVEINNGIEWVGSIAGKIEGDIYNNFYVHDSIAAIDGISYSGKASPLTYDELLQVENLPEPFSELYLTFIADGEVIDKVAFKYGDSFDLEHLPKIPTIDNHDAYWEDFNHDKMTFNTTVEAIYNPFSTVISSNISRHEDELPLLLAEGQFHKGVSIDVSPFNMDNIKFPIDDKKVIEAWNIELEDFEAKDEVSTLRLLLPEGKDKVMVWKYEDDTWKRLSSSMQGSYVSFDIDGSSGTFAIVESTFPLALIVIIVLTLLIIIFFVGRLFYIRRKEVV